MNAKDEAIKLNAEQLKTLTQDIIRLEEEMLTNAELKGRADSAASFYKTYFEKVLNLLMYEQLKFMGTKAPEDWWMFCRGTMNGLDLIIEWFERAEAISKAQIGSPEWTELFGDVIPSITSITDKINEG